VEQNMFGEANTFYSCT